MAQNSQSATPTTTQVLSVDELKEALPASLKKLANQDMADRVNQYAGDPDFAKMLRDNVVSYTTVFKDGRFKISDYISAVTYVSLKMMSFNNQDAWAKTFPQRYQALVARGADAKEISAYVSAYNKNKLVNLILEQTLIPSWVLNQGIYQEAINTQAELMTFAKSEKVRSDAANSILTHLKKPESQKVELDIGVKENSGMLELNEMLASLAQRQQDMIAQGTNTKEIAHQPLVKESSRIDQSAEDAEEIKK